MKYLPSRFIAPSLAIVMTSLFASFAVGETPSLPKTTQLKDNGGKILGVRSPTQNDAVMWLWFYEWSLFDAVVPGQSVTNAAKLTQWNVAQDGKHAMIQPPGTGMALDVTAVSDGAELVLRVTNNSDRDWPEFASIVPCFNPGRIRGDDPNTRFMDTERERTYYLDGDALVPLRDKKMRCEHRVGTKITSLVNAEQAKKTEHAMKWELSRERTTDGLMIREGKDVTPWVSAIAWDSFLSLQGHNPWECMHLAVKVGPLARGESKQIRGRIYLFEGTKEQLVTKYRKEFGR